MQSFILHPLTHEVYALDEADVFHDHGIAIEMGFDDFEKLSQTGPMSAERLVNFANRSHGGFHFAQIVFLRFATNPNRYAWASRIKVRVDGQIPMAASGAMVLESEFLFIWPPSAAINAFLNYKERNRLSMSSSTLLDEYEPSVSHRSSTPGAQIGPDDFDTAVHVPLEDLDVNQRFFISHIRPQRTQFQRRTVTDQWASAMRDADDEAMARYKRSEPATKAVVDCREIACAVRWAKAARPRLQTTPDAFEMQKLPDEVTTRIVCMALASALTESTNITKATICTLRSVSKRFRALTDGFVGITLSEIASVYMNFVKNGTSDSALNVGARVRALGLAPRHVLEMLHEKERVKVSSGVLDAFPRLSPNQTVPRWQTFVQLRSQYDRSAVKETTTKTKEIPSIKYQRLRSVLSPQNGNGVDVVVVNPEYDRIIAMGSVASDLSELMLTAAGV